MPATSSSTSYKRAVAGFDEDFERALVAAITTAITEISRASDANVICLRTGETASALLTVLAGMLAMSPAAARSPRAIRKTCDELQKRLRARVAHATADPELQDFLARVFHGPDVGGRA
jgi:hypothetical protein